MLKLVYIYLVLNFAYSCLKNVDNLNFHTFVILFVNTHIYYLHRNLRNLHIMYELWTFFSMIKRFRCPSQYFQQSYILDLVVYIQGLFSFDLWS